MNKSRQLSAIIYKCLLEMRTDHLSTRYMQIFIPLLFLYLSYKISSSTRTEHEETMMKRLLYFHVPMVSIIFLFPLTPVLQRMINEKTNGLKQLIKLTGVKDVSYYGGFFITYFALNYLLALIFTITSLSWKYFLPTALLNMTIFTGVAVMFTMAFTAFFNNVIYAVVAFSIVWCISGFLDTILFNVKLLPDFVNLILIIVMPPPYLFRRLLQTKNFLAGYTQLASIMSFFWWILILWYIENLCPFEDGVRKSFYYIFLKSYWKPKPVPDHEMEDLDTKYFEPEPTDLHPLIQIRGVRKYFGGKMALRHVDLNVYDNQITVLLGHDCAGKSTMMNIIAGIYPPSRGRVTIDGYDVTINTEQARKNLGYCPQYLVLFEGMTAIQNLSIIAKLKGIESNQVDREVKRILHVVNLSEVCDLVSAHLSSGMRKRLQLGMALIGNSNVLILDEPSSGLNIEARKEIWDILKELKNEVLIFMTTHHMIEADYLGDRIAIMTHGEVKCCGRSTFLKAVFGVGHNLRIVKTKLFDRKLFEMMLHHFLETACFESESLNEINYIFKEEEESFLKPLFHELDLKKHHFGVRAYGITVTTFEDVFLKVGLLFGHEKAIQLEDSTITEDIKPELKNKIETKVQIRALLLKRFQHGKRSLPSFALYTFINYGTAIFFMRHCTALLQNYDEGIALMLLASCMIGLHMPISSVILFPTHETISKFKFLQMMTGLSESIYWIANFIFDFSTFIIITSGFVVIPIIASVFDLGFTIFFFDVYTGGIFFFTYYFYIISTIFLSYYLLHFTETSMTALLINLLSPIFLILVVTFVVSSSIKIFDDIFKFKASVLIFMMKPIIYIFSLWPMIIIFYNLNKLSILHHICLNNLTTNYTICEEQDLIGFDDFTDFSKITLELFFIFIYAIIIPLITLYSKDNTQSVESFGSGFINDIEDDDLNQERKRVDIMIQQNRHNEDALLIQNLTEIYNEKYVVNKISFGVHKEEIFGLLGINGAGKTSVIQMLAGERKPSNGESFIGNLSLKNDAKVYQMKIGLCSQYDYIIEKLTGKEMLYLFARLRGVPNDSLVDEVNRVINSVDLFDCIDCLASKYSGADKRKLSLGLALIGSPKLLLLDEPSAGVDPITRKKMWKAIKNAKNKGASIIIASNLVDECEFLCDRIGIIVSGELKCLGSPHHILTKFGDGFYLILTLKLDQMNQFEIIEMIRNKFEGSILIKENANEMHFDIRNKTMAKELIIEYLENLKTNQLVNDYKLTDRNLESVFLHFSKMSSKTVLEIQDSSTNLNAIHV